MENTNLDFGCLAEFAEIDNGRGYGKIIRALGELALADKAISVFHRQCENGELPKDAMGEMENALNDAQMQAQNGVYGEIGNFVASESDNWGLCQACIKKLKWG